MPSTSLSTDQVAAPTDTEEWTRPPADLFAAIFADESEEEEEEEEGETIAPSTTFEQSQVGWDACVSDGR